ncbi:MAG: peroxiredoxin [Pirellulales bacterium]|nr:peroxiredoxin [Pirellulales bacterium]
MSRWLGKIFLLAVVCGFFVTLADAAEVKVGEPAPDFELAGSDGKTHKLADYAGKTVIVAWFPRAFTPGCTKECKSFAEQGKLLREFDVVYFTASCDPVEENTKFAESLKCDYPILSDPTRAAALAYGLVANEKGNAARKTFIIGADGKLLAVIDKVDTAGHAQQVAEKLAELKVPAAKKE